MSRFTLVVGETDVRRSLGLAYDLWLTSWETAQSALAAATRSRALGTDAVAAHLAVIKIEREVVTKQFAALRAHGAELHAR
jgi:hypothetical protein